VGMLVSYGFSFIVALLVDRYLPDATAPKKLAITNYLNIVIAVVFPYLAISFILQTKDDFRFIIPYVEFARQTKGSRPLLLDTSVLIDGRVTDIAMTGLLESQVIVPRFVLDELQAVADSADRLKRARGRRGLDVLTKLRGVARAEVILYDTSA